CGSGGMIKNDSTAILTDIAVSGNCGGYGGGMCNKDSSPILTNVTVSGNWANYGGGIYNASSSPKIYNSVVWANGTSAIQGANIDGNSSYNLIEGGHASNIAGYTDGTAGLEADDIFEGYVAATTEPTTAGDFRLKASSPAINAGSNELYEAADDDEDNLGKDTDLAGNPRVHNQTDGGIIDIGAFESPYAPISPTDGILYVNIHVND